MKRKIIFIAVFSYLALIILILIIGLNLPQVEQPTRTENESLAAESTSQVEKEGQSYSDTPADFIGNRTWTESSTLKLETELSQSPSPHEISTITEDVETPSPIEPTLEIPSLTLTSEAYPNNGDSGLTTTTQPYPVDDPADASFTPTFIISPTSTPTTQTGWGGEWTVFWEQSDGGFLSGLMEVNLDGSDLTASVSMGEDLYNFTGILNESSVTVVGSWSGSGESGYFYWRTFTLGQFSGNLDRQLGFCGARDGGNPPDPCLHIPSGN